MRDPTDIYNWRRVDKRLTTSGQPTEAQLVEIQQLGATHIVNLGMHDHERALADEGASVVALGMTYVHIPVAFDNPTEDDFQQFCVALSEMGAAQHRAHDRRPAVQPARPLIFTFAKIHRPNVAAEARIASQRQDDGADQDLKRRPSPHHWHDG